MTICIAISCKTMWGKKERPVVLFASDTQESSLFLKRPVVKIKRIFGGSPKKYKEPWGILIGSAGDALVIDEICHDLTFFLRRKISPDVEKPSLHLVALRKEIGDLAYSTYKKYKDRGEKNPTFELLIGACDEFATILHVTYEGKTQQLEKFGIIGSGRITGGELLLREVFRDGLSDMQAANLAALVVTIVGHVDISVGGMPDIQICAVRRPWIFKEAAFNEILKQSEAKWGAMKKVWWKMQEDKTFEKKLEKLLKK